MTTQEMELERMAKVAYYAYTEARSYDLASDPLPRWVELDAKCQQAWLAAIQLNKL